MIELINANALQIPLKDESVGLIMTSPPYNVGLNYEGYEDKLSDDEFKKFIYDSTAECYRVMKPNSRAYFILGENMLWWFRGYAEEIGFTYGQLMTWCKPNLVGGRGRISKDWHTQSEHILMFRKGKRTPMISSRLSNCYNWFVEVVDQTNFKNGRHHVAQLPFSLCVKILARTPGEPVLDPFCGSGQVCRAAKALNRSTIGIDLIPNIIRRAKNYVMTNAPELGQQPVLFETPGSASR